MDTKDCKIGTYVRTNYGYEGRVFQLHDGCPEKKWWLDMQNDPRMRVFAAGPWASVLVHPAGSVTAPVALLEELEPFDFENPYAEDYLADVDSTVSLAETFRRHVEQNGTIATLGPVGSSDLDLLVAAFEAGLAGNATPETHLGPIQKVR